MRHPVSAAGWLALYVVLAAAPLVLSLVNLDPGRGFWVNLSVGLGFLGLSLMGLQFVLAARFARATEAFGFDVVLQAHRQMTVLITVCILAHPAVLFVWYPRFLALLNVVEAPARARFAVASVVLLLVLIATSLWRRAFRLGYQTWQVLHAVLAVLIVVTGLTHVLLIGYYVDQRWEQAVWILYSVAFIGIGVWVRLLRPLVRWRRRWTIVEIREQPGHGHTVRLSPVHPEAFGRGGFAFEPGQFAWIYAGRSPFAMAYHPFSISSSAEQRDAVEFTIKTEHGFTAQVHSLEPGRLVYLDGPWGHFTMQRHEGPGFVFVGGGIGITPLLSMLATMADRGDTRPCWVFVGNRHEGQVVGFTELESLATRMNLTVVHSLSDAGPSWTGHRGRVDAAVLDEVLPAQRQRLQYFMCGSPPMMDTTEAALRHLGIPDEQVHSERFAMA